MPTNFLIPEIAKVGIADIIMIPTYIGIDNGAVPMTLLKNGIKVTRIDEVAANPTANVNLELENGFQSNNVLTLLAS